jgi:hypothetical protein
MTPGENTLYMRAWTRCFRTRYAAQTTGFYVRYFWEYRRWLTYRSLISPGRRMRWREE